MRGSEKFTSRSDLVITQAWDVIHSVHHTDATIVVVIARFKGGSALVEIRPAADEALRRLKRDYPELREIIDADHRPDLIRIVYIEESTGTTRFVALPIGLPD